ncbi:hypothetical protein F2Q69_00001556 [Brassica cretica]|uniref:Uncharacterized protein n=1 Tax=Brassica cretica TaxID=69181 RepID=A0A8S9P180_BRACR|nr:hypothetical protein F2Q69_00001556 [Brassica cretica]
MVESGGDWFSNNQPHPQDLQMQQLGSSVPDFLSARSILPAGKQQPTALMRRRKGLGVPMRKSSGSKMGNSESSGMRLGLRFQGSTIGDVHQIYHCKVLDCLSNRCKHRPIRN